MINNTILNGNLPIKMNLIQYGVNIKKYLILKKKGYFKGLKNKEKIEEYNIPQKHFDGTQKKQGISGIARLRNAEQFLKQSIESYLPFFDEIILADNMSEDNTRKICLDLKNKYQNKIITIQYPFKTHKLGSDEYKQSTSDSVYDLSYFYNWTLSHVNYKRVAKIDDDQILIPELMEKNREIILNDNEYKTYYQMGGINIIKIDNNQRGINKKEPLMGIYGDHGIFPISFSTYFIHDKKCENFMHNLKIKRLPFSFFHLKFLKQDKGTANYVGKYKKELENHTDGNFIPLPNSYKKYSDILYKIDL